MFLNKINTYNFHKSSLVLVLFLLICTANSYSQSYENCFSKPLAQVLQEISTRFNVKLIYNVDTAGKVVPYADFRIRPYSVEESLSNVLALFDSFAALRTGPSHRFSSTFGGFRDETISLG